MSVLKSVEKLEHSCTAWREYKTVQPLWKRVWQFLKWQNTELACDPATPPEGLYPREMEMNTNAHHGIIHNRENKNRISTTEEWTKCGLFINAILFINKKK